ncbi:alpha/beta hydrolase [Streptomyces sp. CRN 30]|uniref:alpha/beta fold hydrolase n=1 Tax=Streptomyces sp. CRN 30 TaxID=3075613 RepID=UPI002A7FF693|nr:alpha/beta hydrolase [Streptomyces sp. CRN 30]
MTTSALPASETPLSEEYDAATRDDPEFARLFQHRFTTIDGLQMHYVVGGDGPRTIVLLHGFSESWYEYRAVMPDLLPGHTVIAVDLPGLGDTTGELPSHDKVILARYVHRLLLRLGHRDRVQLVAHDFGSAVAYALAAQWPEQFAGLMIMDFGLVGSSLTFDRLKPLSFHFSFFQQEPLFEQLVTGRERLFLSYFYGLLGAPAPRPNLDEYTRVYSRPGVLRHGSRYYRAWPQDEADNRRLMAEPLTMPVHLIAQAQLLDTFLTALRDAAPHATGNPVEGVGHWLLHEAPERVLQEIKTFYDYQD